MKQYTVVQVGLGSRGIVECNGRWAAFTSATGGRFQSTSF